MLRGVDEEQQANAEDRLKPLADFLPELDSADFDFGHWVPSERRAPGVMTMPYFAFSPQGLALIATMPALPTFDWPRWKDTPEGQALLNDQARVAKASADEVMRLTTTLLRGDRFTDGVLANAYASGLLRAIVIRAGQLTS